MDEDARIELQIHLARDDETGWWYVADSDIPGLVLEASSAAALMEKIEAAAPEMIELNCREIIERHVAEPQGKAIAAARPAWSYRPVFDSPLVACA